MTTNNATMEMESETDVVEFDPTKRRVPHKLDNECDRYWAEDVRRQLDREDMHGLELKPGICRMCRKRLPVANVNIPMFGIIPIYQCDRIAGLWEKAEQIRVDRINTELARRRQAAQQGRAGQAKPQERYF